MERRALASPSIFRSFNSMTLVYDSLASVATTTSTFLINFFNDKMTFSYDDRDMTVSIQFAYAIAVALGFIAVSSSFMLHVGSDEQGIPRKLSYPVVGSWAFFTKRYRFLDEGLRRFGNMFPFKILNYDVLALQGQEARKGFFGAKNMGFSGGYEVLHGGSSQTKQINIKRDDESTARVEMFVRRVTSILHREKMKTTLPLMLDDLDRFNLMKKWGTSGSFDPFDDIYNMVFQITIRAATCKEIADDPEAVKKVTKLYWDAEKGSTPASILLPWFPSAARRRKLKAIKDMYTLFKHYIDERTSSGKVEDDPLQTLLDGGDGANDIVSFIMRALFAGIINTGIMSSWLVLYFAENAGWKEKALKEIRNFVSQYSSKEKGQTLAQQLEIPSQVWEDEMPVLDLCLRETIRRTLTSAALRRALQGGDEDPNMIIKGKKLKKGQFLVYHVAGTHHNPEIYTDPYKWDPSRFERGEDKKEQWAFVGWGAGRHPCAGMRFAKLEVKVILSLLLLQYDYDVVDGAGNVVNEIPEPERDNLYQSPPSKTCYVRYRRV